MDNATIRPAVVSDAPGLAHLNRLFNGESPTEAEIAHSLLTNNREQVFVAQGENGLIGFICVQVFQSMCYTSNYAEITELFVLEAHRQKGVGKRLMQFAEEAVKTGNVKGYQLFTGGENHPAQRFYESLGYTATNEIMYRKRL